MVTMGTAFCAGAEAVPGAPTCVLLTKEGKVEVARKGTTQWSPAQTNQTLQIGDRLRTGLRSRATLRWSESSVMRVDELTSLEIQPPAKATDKPQLDLKSGTTYFFSRERPTEIQFRTPVASGAIRGTEFNLAVAEDGRSVLSLLDGEVDLVNAQGSVTLKSGEQGTVAPGGAPAKTALIDAINVIQWVLYYPVVIDPKEIGLSAQEQQSLAEPLEAYRSGDLLQAVGKYPENREPASDAERVLHAALLLAVGRVDKAEADLGRTQSPLARAIREMIAAVKNQKLENLSEPATASEWMARSYTFQSRSQLAEALQAAREAAKKSPEFGAAWIRVAELEASFGRTSTALEAMNRGLELSPQNAQGLALKGFLLSAQNKTKEAMDYFDRAIAVDGALANAWLGRGLLKIRDGHSKEGREDLQVAATLEPQRGVLRSYLGKAYAYGHDVPQARKELVLAENLDPNDPTAWLYSALLNQEENRINDAVHDLEKSKELNDNRSVFRSRQLLDQDLAVRSANLASIYRDVGMFDTSVQEAARSVSYDYGNYSSHLFLANSYASLRDPKLINLRYETPAFSELLIANLLAPANAGAFSPNVSQQEYARLFQANHFGVFSETEYFSDGSWIQNGSQYGIYGNMSYSLDAFYRTENGQRPNNDLEQLNLALQLRYQITAKDSVYAQVSYFDSESGDVAQYYNQQGSTNLPGPIPSKTFRANEDQEPNVLLGYHREWTPGSHTLFLATRFDDTLTLEDRNSAPLYQQTVVNPFTGATNISLRATNGIPLDYRSELEAYSAELQHIWKAHGQTLLVGGRYQVGWPDTTSEQAGPPSVTIILLPGGGVSTQVVARPVPSSADTQLDRVSFYAYDYWQVLDQVQLTAGLSYDRLHFPVNIDTSPITDKEDTTDRVSPKAGLLVTPWKYTHLRAFYSQSLGGVFFDNSVRLEPTQINGFLAAPRSAIPESVVGLVPGTRFETYGVGLDQTFKGGTYVVVQGQILDSDANRTVGVLVISDTAPPSAAPDSASSVRQSLEYTEKSFIASLSQLIGNEFAVGVRYKLTDADLDAHFYRLPANVGGVQNLNQDVSATLHQVNLYGIFNHPSGFFAQFNAIWSQQSNRDYVPDIPGDDFWQFNVSAGYRFLQRRVEAAVGLLNLTDQDYRLNPLTLYNELPRERTLVASLKIYF